MSKSGLLLTACVLLTIVSVTNAYAPTTYIIDPGKVILATRNQIVAGELTPVVVGITGSVTLTKKTDGSGDVSTSGGGCLIFLRPKATQCAKDSDCTIETKSEPIVGYCTDSTDDTELIQKGLSTRACWYQPERASCHRSITSPLVLGEPIKFDNPTDIHPPGVTDWVRWRVVSCQNKVDLGCHDRKLGGYDYRYGPIREFD